MSSDIENHPKPWLVRSGGKIFGPLSTADVENQLRSKTLLPLDEILYSYGRWHYIRDEMTFDRVILELRSKFTSVEETMTLSATDTFGSGRTVTEKIESTAERLNRVEKITSSPNQTETFVYEGDKKTQEEVTQKSVPKFIWLCVVAMAGILIYLVFQKNQGARHGEAQFDYQKGASLFLSGQFDEARVVLEKAMSSGNQAFESGILLAKAIILNGETVLANRVLEDLSETQSDPQKIKEIENLRGLTYLMESKLDEAKKSFSFAIKVDPGFEPAIFNMAVLNVQKKNFVEAKSLLQSLRGVENPVVAAFMTEMLMIDKTAPPDEKTLLQGLEFVDSQINKSQEYRQELLVFKLALQAFLNKPEASETLESILNQDPEYSDHIVPNVSYYLGRVNWTHISNWTDEVAKTLPKGPRVLALQALAKFKSQRKQEGKVLLEDASKQAPKDAVILTLLGYFESQMGRDEEAEVNFKLASEVGESGLTTLIRARMCEKSKDFACAQPLFEKLVKKNPKNLAAVSGLAGIKLSQGDLEGARASVGSFKKTNYIPINRILYGIENAHNP